MATEKNISSRIIHKHDIGANWNKATNFIPKAGEIIVYDKDETINYERFKIGDGETAVAALPFGSVQPDWNQNNHTANDYIKNRPFYTQETATVIYEKSSGLYESANVIKPPENDPSDCFHNAGHYRFTMNGTDVFSVFKQITHPHGTSANLINVTTDSYSVAILEFDPVPEYGSMAFPPIMVNKQPISTVPNSIKIEYIATQTQKIDEKFIPDTIARTTNIDEKISEHNSSTEAHPDIRSDISSSITALKDELLNGAGEAYDTLKELGDLIDENHNAIDALEIVANSKQDKLSGAEGQVVGFDENGNAVAQDNPQVNWNQNDENASDYVRGRTHWEENTELVSEQTVIIDGYGFGTIDTNAVLVEGKLYEVTLNGNIFLVTAQLLDKGDFQNNIVLGNPHIMSSDYENTGHNFACAYRGDSIYLQINDPDKPTYTLAIKELVIQKLDEKYLPHNIQSDWNQNGTAALNYVKNRPFYSYYTFGEIMPLQTVAFSSGMAESPVVISLIEGGSYTVSFNGMSYECIAKKSENDFICIGNGKMFGLENTGEPFVYFNNDAAQMYMWGCFSSEITDAPVAVYGTVEETVKLQNKYLDWNNYPVKAPIIIEADNLLNLSAEQKQYYYDTWSSGSLLLCTGSDEGNICGVFYNSSNNDFMVSIITSYGALITYNDAENDGKYREYKNLLNTQDKITGTQGQIVGFDKNGNPIAQNTVGKNVEGKTFNIYNPSLNEYENDVVAGAGAEIFNDYEGNAATGMYSHAEGVDAQAKGLAAHAEGRATFAYGNFSHAEGASSIAVGMSSHAEGSMSEAYGNSSHAEGKETFAHGVGSHTEGYRTSVSGDYSHAQGKCNVYDEDGVYAHIVGNGENHDNRSNAHTLDWNGNAWFAGDVYVGSNGGTNKDEGSKKLATEEYVDIRVPAWTEADEGKVLKIVDGVPTWADISDTSTDDGDGNVVIS